MIINVSDLSSFERFIDCSQQMSAMPIAILFFKEQVPPKIAPLTNKPPQTPFTDFTFALCTPIYQVIFKGTKLNEEFEDLETSFRSMIQTKNGPIHVEEFDSIKVKYLDGLITL